MGETLRASELVTMLQAAIAQHGDLPVYRADDAGTGVIREIWAPANGGMLILDEGEYVPSCDVEVSRAPVPEPVPVTVTTDEIERERWADSTERMVESANEANVGDWLPLNGFSPSCPSPVEVRIPALKGTSRYRQVWRKTEAGWQRVR